MHTEVGQACINTFNQGGSLFQEYQEYQEFQVFQVFQTSLSRGGFTVSRVRDLRIIIHPG